MKRLRDDGDVEHNHIDKKQKPQDSIYHEILNENDAKEIIRLTKNDGFFNDNKSSIYKNMINYTNQALLYNSEIYQTMLNNGIKITFPCIGKQDYSIKLINANYLRQNKSFKITKEEFSNVKIIFLGIFLITKQKTTNNLILNYLKWSLIPESFKSQNLSNDDFYLIDHTCLNINSFLDIFMPIKEEEEEVIKDIEPFSFSNIEKINNQEYRELKAKILKKERPKKELSLEQRLDLSSKSKEHNDYLKKKKLMEKHWYFNEKTSQHIAFLYELNSISQPTITFVNGYEFRCILWYKTLIADAKLIIDTPYFNRFMRLVDKGKYCAEYMQKLSLEQRLDLSSDFNEGMRFIKGLENLKKQGSDIEHLCVIMKDANGKEYDVWCYI